MRILFPKREEPALETYENINANSSLYKLLSRVGPVMTESLLNFHTKSGDRGVYKNVVNRKTIPYFKSYIRYFNSIEKGLAGLVADSYKELQKMKDYELEGVYAVFDSGKDGCARQVWREKYGSMMNARNKIMKDELDPSTRLPKLDYLHSINANYANIFSYNFKKEMDPRKAKSLLYKKTLKIGHDPKAYTDFNLFSLNDRYSVALAFYGRAIEITDFMDMFNSIDYSMNKGSGKNVKPVF